MIDLRECRELARESGAYTDIELEILDEALDDSSSPPAGGAPDGAGVLVELRDGKVLAGFALARREEVSEYTFNIQAICVGPSYRGTGAPASLLGGLEEEVLRRADSAILRFETSSAKGAAFGSGVLDASGYALIGHIPDFYAQGNDYYMYAKHLRADGRGGRGEV
jgi:hypothetical protein